MDSARGSGIGVSKPTKTASGIVPDDKSPTNRLEGGEYIE